MNELIKKSAEELASLIRKKEISSAGIPALQDSFIFITPGNCLGLPSVALPMDLVDGLPSGIQIYSGLYREDLCLSAAEIIQNEVPCPSPTNPS